MRFTEKQFKHMKIHIIELRCNSINVVNSLKEEKNPLGKCIVYTEWL